MLNEKVPPAFDDIEVSEDELKNRLEEYLERVSTNGERIVILRDSRPMAELRPVKPPATAADLIAFFKEGPRLDPDELDAFERDIEGARPR